MKTNTDIVRTIYADGEMLLNPDGHELDSKSEYRIAHSYPAADEDVRYVLNLDPNLSDGETRTEWLWLRLANGDLCLATFPQDEGYMSLEDTFR